MALIMRSTSHWCWPITDTSSMTADSSGACLTFSRMIPGSGPRPTSL
jgi:hypothetical protein